MLSIQGMKIPTNMNISPISFGDFFEGKGLKNDRKDANVLGICKTYDKIETGG